MNKYGLKKTDVLEKKITVYVPSTINVNVEIDNTMYVKKTATILSKCFGGATKTEAVGYWVSDEYGLVEEKTILISSSCTEEQFEQHKRKIVAWIRKMKKELKQEAMTLEVGMDMLIIR